MKNKGSLPLLIEYISCQQWAMDLPTLQRMLDIVDRHIQGGKLTASQIEAATKNKAEKASSVGTFQNVSGTAVIQIGGIIAKHSRLVNDVSLPRGISIETLRPQLERALEDDQVESVFLLIESPGGYLDGVADFAAEVFEASHEKPVVAFADDLAASGAYWIGSQANAFYTNTTGLVGSIGVYSLFVDSSKRAEKEGLKYHIFRSGQHKGVGAPGVEITQENREAMQTVVDDTHEIFVEAILRGRADSGLTESKLRKLSDGKTYMGKTAVRYGLVDGVTTLEKALNAKRPAVRIKRSSIKQKATTEKAVANNVNVNVNIFERVNKMSTAVMTEPKPDKAQVYPKRVQALIAGGASRADAHRQATNELSEAKADWLRAGAPAVGEKLTGDDEIKLNADIYRAALKSYQSKGLSKADSHRKAARTLPACHDAWVSTGAAV